MKTVDKMIHDVANYFLTCMKDNDFESFDEMKDCYWWTSQDIKNEVDAVLKEGDWSIDELDGSDIFDNNSNLICSYRSFMSKVYKLIK